MTLTKYDKFAVVPKRCNRCNRLFWLEPYNIHYKTVGIGCQSIIEVECKFCVKADWIRTYIMTPNEVRMSMGLKVENDPEAEKLIKKEE